MRAGDVVRFDFGTPTRGEPGFVGPVALRQIRELFADLLGL